MESSGSSGGWAREAKGCPNWEVGIMGRINMQGLDTCGGGYEGVAAEDGRRRGNKRGRRGRARRGGGPSRSV